MKGKLFINYRRDDTRHPAGRLYDRLIQRFGEDQVFMDIDQIEPGEDFVEVINRKVGTCDVAIVAIGPNWLGTTNESGKRRLDDEEDFVRMEIVAALQRNIRVIPVLVDGARMPRKQDLPKALARLSRLNAIELSETRFHADVNRLIAAIEKYFAIAETKVELSTTPAPPTKRRLLDQGNAEPYSAFVTPQAQYELGKQYENGEGVPQDYGKAKELYRKAADQGCTDALRRLGGLYYLGRGVPQDYGKARELYQEAADKGNTEALVSLGQLYQYGHGVPQDYWKARELYQKAADQGDALGELFLNHVLDANSKG